MKKKGNKKTHLIGLVLYAALFMLIIIWLFNELGQVLS
jgi:hypothetical protein